jgi:ferrous iron transport protein B
MEIRIALAGNPNSGKTTLFNALTGSNQYVGNWPGVTVEKKEGFLKGHPKVRIVDLPGIYSLSPYTLEEVVARNYLVEEKPDVILNLIDGTNLERNLYLTTQLSELGIPMVLAINMMDVVEKNGDHIDVKGLTEDLGQEAVEISALKGTGIFQAAQMAMEAVGKTVSPKDPHPLGGHIEHALAHIEDGLRDGVPEKQLRWFSVKVFERDEKIWKHVNLSSEEKKAFLDKAEEEIRRCEESLQDDAESLVTNARYEYVTRLTKGNYRRKNNSLLTPSDRIDRIVTHKWLALPIFALVMFVVYYVSVTTVGAFVTDWTNEVLFGDWVPGGVESLLLFLNTAPWLNGLILDGIVAGVGAVLGFVPQMFVLFAFLALLEGCGYMARVAFIMDRLFRKFGLSGKSFIPMLVGTGCGVPGVMASRTIESENDRRMTVMTTTFVPCGAKLPIIALIAGAIFQGAWWVAPSAYFVGIGAIIVSGVILKKTKMFSGEPSPFVMELPSYHPPLLGNVARSTWERGYSFIKKAGTIVLLATIVIWFLSNFGWSSGGVEMVEDLDQGFLAAVGGLMAPLFVPLGWGNWQTAVATITGFVAKENVVGTLGVLYGMAQVSENGVEIWGAMAAGFTTLSAYSFLVFNLLCAPCFAAIGAIKREMNSPKWTWFALGYQTLFAYSIALIVFQVGTFVITGNFTIGTFFGFLTLGLLGILLFRKKGNSCSSGKLAENKC